jgi:hypothetical protein
MPTHTQWTVTVPTTEQANGSSGTTIHQKAFPASPIHSGELTAESLKAKYIELVQGPVVNDGGHTFGEIGRDYGDAPNLDDVEVGGGGLPGSPYAPNIASPSDGVNPRSIPESGVEVTAAAKGSGDPFNAPAIGTNAGGLPNPQASSANVSRVTLGTLGAFGTSTPKS